MCCPQAAKKENTGEEFDNITLLSAAENLGMKIYTDDNKELSAIPDGTLYRIDYEANGNDHSNLPAVNIALVVMTLLLLIVLLIVRNRVLKPFFTLREVPYELSKGNLTVPIGENRHRMFGRFTCGMNMLRENLEQQKTRNERYRSVSACVRNNKDFVMAEKLFEVFSSVHNNQNITNNGRNCKYIVV